MFFLKKKFFNNEEEKRIITSIKKAERSCSGEVRLYVESRCDKTVQERTIEVFKKLRMQKTRERNAVLVYIAIDDRQFTIFGDEGIHQKMGFQFWTKEAATLKSFLVNNQTIEGICQVIEDIGVVMQEHFPYPPDDKDELSNKPVYGR